MNGSDILALVLLGVVVFFFGLIFYFVPIGLWITALFSGVRVRISTLIGMRLRKVPPGQIVRPLISATKAEIDLEIGQMEAHFLAGGNVGRVIDALISADRAAIELPWQRATAIDLAGRDVLQAVQMSVNPKVIDTPRVAAVAKDGIQVVAVARVTVRANIDRLVGGAGEETVIARVGEGTVSGIGSAESHKWVLENPEAISKRVLERGLDQGTAFEILSIDIADVDIGEMWVQNSRQIKPMPTKRSLRHKLSNDVQWLWPKNKKCALEWWKQKLKFHLRFQKRCDRAISA